MSTFFIRLWNSGYSQYPKLAGALTHFYNNWLRDFCSYKSLLGMKGGVFAFQPQGRLLSDRLWAILY